MRSTANDVARLARVSVSTVSRALTVPEKVSPETRRRVQEAARALHYLPNRAARGLATGRTGNVGLVVPDLGNPYFSSLTKAVQARARSLGYAVFVADTDEDSTLEPQILQNLAKQVDGVILVSSRSTDDKLRERAGETPTVLLNREVAGLTSVIVDNASGVRQSLHHLWALGHRDIAYVGGPRNSWSDSARRTAMTTLAEEFDGMSVRDLGTYKPYFSGGIAAADIVLASPATAVVVYNDLMALGLLDRVKERGVAVPEELSITAFDNTMLASAVRPHLTTVHIPNDLLARRALDLLVGSGADQLDADSPERHIVPVDLMVRGTTGPLLVTAGTTARR